MSKNFVVHKNVILGKNVQIGEGVIIGQFGGEGDAPKTIIGDNAVIREYTVIYAGVTIGNNFQTGPHVLIREQNEIGDNVVVWHGATLNPGNKIGDGSRIHAGCFLEDVILGEKVFLGPRVTFTDDPHPVVPIKFRDCWKGAVVGNKAVVGGNVTVLPHAKIGTEAVVGAGSVVVKDIPAKMVAVGNPAKVIKRVEEVECERGSVRHFPYKKEKK